MARLRASAGSAGELARLSCVTWSAVAGAVHGGLPPTWVQGGGVLQHGDGGDDSEMEEEAEEEVPQFGSQLCDKAALIVASWEAFLCTL